jgi:hypothetical protein
MPISKERGEELLKQYLSQHWWFSIPVRDLEDILPRVPRPSAQEMEFIINYRSMGVIEPESLTMKLEAMDEKEFLDHFCKKYGFEWNKTWDQKTIQFKWIGKDV